MCGIVGYVGKHNPKDFLLEGLKTLEYRGYDSAGIALKNNEETQIIKSVGKIKFLEEKVNNSLLIDSKIGIAHTRWATHGAPTENNAHPHCVGKVTIVHNGIIENAREIKDKLKVNFNSDTDTEVAAALIDYYYDGDEISAISKAVTELTGSYAFGILFEDSDKLYAVRKGSPLIIGINDKENYIASDITAIINYTNKYILLEEGEIAVLSAELVKVFKDGKEIKKDVIIADISAEAKSKQGFDHYMLKEIMEEPMLIENTLKPFVEDMSLIPDLKKYSEIHIVACGSAMYAGMIGKALLEEKASIRVICEVASEYRYKKVLYDKNTLVILVSQSGETADTIAAMRKAKEEGADTLAIVNVKTSTIARETDKQIFIEAGPEIAVATTKAYILQVAIFGLLAYKAASLNNLADEVKKLPRYVKEILDNRDLYLKIANEIYKDNDVFFIGRKTDYAICMEGSLKLKEVSYVHSEAYQAGELKHGTISLIEDGTPVFGIITDDDIRDKTISNIEEVKSRGAKVIIVSNKKVPGYDMEVIVPKISEFFQPILVVPCLQLIAYEVAKLRGCDIDKPKNLAKSVTVE